MEAQIKLGSIAGIQIGLHVSWVVIALLITFSLGSHFAATNPSWSTTVVWVSAVVTALLFFVTILVHELSHALVARARGLPVRSITLFALGGVATIERDAADPATEFWMGIVGPITSAVIGVACLAAALLLGWAPEAATMSPPVAVLGWLGAINVTLAVFNMIPGYPLDGGRILRSVAWWITGDSDRATRMAARGGQIVALAFVVLGMAQFFAGAGLGGLWLAFVGWFLFDAARASLLHAEAVASLRGLRVADAMASDLPAVDGNTNLTIFAEENLLRTGQRAYLVETNGAFSGLVTTRDLARVERARWPYTTVHDVMRPRDELHTVSPELPLVEALETMAREDLNQVPVVSGGRLAGILSRGSIIRLLRTRAELNM